MIGFFGYLQSQDLQSQVADAQADVASLVSGPQMGRDWVLESNWPFALGWWMLLLVVSLAMLMAIELWRVGRESGQREEGGRWKRGLLVGLRALTVLLILSMLGRWQLSRYEVDLPDLVILVDRSESMSLPLAFEDHGTAGSLSSGSLSVGGRSRLDAVKDVLTAGGGGFLRQLADDYRLRVATVGEGVGPLPTDFISLQEQLQDVQADGDASRLGNAVSEAVSGQRGRSTAGIVLISDGVVTEGVSLREAGEFASATRLPVFAVKTGSQYPPPNIEIEELLADSAAMVGDLVRVIARVRWEFGGQEPTEQRSVSVRLRDGENGDTLAEKQMLVSAGRGSEQVELMFTATDAGLRRLKVEVDQIAGEVVTTDNSAETTVDIRDESFRVLLVQGSASYEFRFLKHLLERATNRDGTRQLVELISVLQTGDPRYSDQDRTARRLPPVDNETLEKLDLIILSDCDPQGLGRALQNRIVELVTGKGLSLVVIAGPNHLPEKLTGTPLESLLPVDPQYVINPENALRGMSWRLTALGGSVASLQVADTAQAWNQAPPLYWLARANSLRPGARVLLETTATETGDQRLPIVVSQLAGNGQVWLQLTDESFRLRAADVDAELYERYWLQLVRTLAQGRQVADDDEANLEIAGDRFLVGAPIPFEVRLGSRLTAVAGGQVRVSVNDQQGRSEIFVAEVDAAGRGYQGLIQNLPVGVYRAVLAGPLGSGDPPSDTFVIEQQDQEMAETAVDLGALEDLAVRSGGALIDIEEVQEKLRSLLPEGKTMRIRALEPVVIWNHWLVCTLLFGLLSAQWILRRRFGGL